ncbi:MAG: peptide chain release factor 1 [Candidatus Muiribacterium halophilum]|uniref:Peptide chain release factor 1 n=1 Tax=Muiribacterium halophilum TaxID=2053465 RepID=A0A2N5ZGF0_MUIH1|nr:MAG: peptide chain release factor 1 [Candidatus Muirbacterium halophilum]
MIEKLNGILETFKEINRKLTLPDVLSDQEEMIRLSKERTRLEPIVEVIKSYMEAVDSVQEAEEILKNSKDDELVEMAKMELDENREKLPEYEEKLKFMLLPVDPNDDKNIIVEIRAGTGGNEAALFAGDLFNMYQRYFDLRGWKMDMMDTNPGEVGGFREIVFNVKGESVYSRMKFESGTHRVQRVPSTESSGRIHTSAATVAVLPEVDDVEIDIKNEDLRIDVFRSGGNGGQSVNTTDSAVRITHLPTNIVVSCQDERSQHKNKARALKILKAKIYDAELQKQEDEISSSRKSMVGSGDRSEKIRTYNYPQNRVTDHRIGLTLHKLDRVVDGSALDEIIDALILAEQEEKLREAES